jgi:hypothetical protein
VISDVVFAMCVSLFWGQARGALETKANRMEDERQLGSEVVYGQTIQVCEKRCPTMPAFA